MRCEHLLQLLMKFYMKDFQQYRFLYRNKVFKKTSLSILYMIRVEKYSVYVIQFITMFCVEGI